MLLNRHKDKRQNKTTQADVIPKAEPKEQPKKKSSKKDGE